MTRLQPLGFLCNGVKSRFDTPDPLLKICVPEHYIALLIRMPVPTTGTTTATTATASAWCTHRITRTHRITGAHRATHFPRSFDIFLIYIFGANGYRIAHAHHFAVYASPGRHHNGIAGAYCLRTGIGSGTLDTITEARSARRQGAAAGHGEHLRPHLPHFTEIDWFCQDRVIHTPMRFALRQLPKVNGVIITSRYQQGVIRTEGHGVDSRRMLSQRGDQAALRQTPEVDSMIITPRGQQRTVRTKGHGVNRRSMPGQRIDQADLWQVPDVDGFIPAPRHQ